MLCDRLPGVLEGGALGSGAGREHTAPPAELLLVHQGWGGLSWSTPCPPAFMRTPLPSSPQGGVQCAMAKNCPRSVRCPLEAKRHVAEMVQGQNVCVSISSCWCPGL
ncbi:hypothetical protein KIL84_008513 [Mauremys mutica]|uniref:Uncharacterized protein n=1 Tax=Mauremys mutica TaxID=74926 RepID=A0A9D4ASH6_9SAUR|nr:hypothetical protein KIL84_008513 [Mauremys mutica]